MPKIRLSKKLFGTFLVFSAIGLWIPHISKAADLEVQTAKKEVQVGQSFSVSLLVSSDAQALNAVSAIVGFPNQMLQVVSLSKTNSIIPLWVEEPNFSNSEGRLSFEGIVLNPGFQGRGGKLLEVTFRAKTSGLAEIAFLSSSVLANDGAGTNILGNPKGTQVKIVPANPSAKASPPGLPKAEIIPLPNENGWINAKEVKIAWTKSLDVTSIAFGFSQSKNIGDLREYPGSVTSTLIQAVSIGEGESIFGIRFKNSAGWGPVQFIPLNLDTLPPEGIELKKIDAQNFSLSAIDSGSGISHYEARASREEGWIRIDIDAARNWQNNISAPEESLWIRVFDRAGNFVEKEFISEAGVGSEIPHSKGGNGRILLSLLGIFLGSAFLWWIFLIRKRKNDSKDALSPTEELPKVVFEKNEDEKDTPNY